MRKIPRVSTTNIKTVMESNWEIRKVNEAWENYYKSQELLEESEFSQLKSVLQTPLPLTFRFTNTANHDSRQMFGIFQNKYLPLLSNIKSPETGELLALPKPLRFYPHDLAWQVDISKRTVKKNERFQEFQKFLVLESDAGNINRQEAVSMIPPLLLGVKPHHKVLDMCAAPGSKTGQLLEALHEVKDPTGFLMANDSDPKRCRMLAHQIKRLSSLNAIIVNHDAQVFPSLRLEGKVLKFDRILCDVPCSGDGTMRKNTQIWKQWTVGNANSLSSLQYRILQRGLDLLEKGGRLVYSTCSLNPVENEAVVLRALKNNRDVKLVSAKLPGLVHSGGLNAWKVFDNSCKVQEMNENNQHLFPDASHDLKDCIRVYPFQQNTGGFFIAVLEKTDDEAVSSNLATAIQDPKAFAAGSEEYEFLTSDNETLQNCFQFYGIQDREQLENSCFVRNSEGGAGRIIYLAHGLIKKLLLENKSKLRLVNTGLRLFVSQRTDTVECEWRVQEDSLPIIRDKIDNERVFDCTLESFKILLNQKYPKRDTFLYVDEKFYQSVLNLPKGCAFIVVKLDDFEIFQSVWLAVSSVNLMLSDPKKAEMILRLESLTTNV